MGGESLVPPPSKEKQAELFDSVLFCLSAGVKCTDRGEGKICCCVCVFLNDSIWEAKMMNTVF